jgi:hypothetical protein
MIKIMDVVIGTVMLKSNFVAKQGTYTIII